MVDATVPALMARVEAAGAMQTGAGTNLGKQEHVSQPCTNPFPGEPLTLLIASVYS